MKRYDVFSFQQALRAAGLNTQTRFGGTGSTLGSLPATISPVSIEAQINGSPFSDSSPLGWYNNKVQQWAAKAGSVEMVYINPRAGGLKESDFTVSGITAPSISAKGNGTSPAVEFDLRKIKADTWFIKGVKISKDLTTNERLVGKDNTQVQFVVSDTNNNYGFENALKPLITPYDGFASEKNLYGPIIPVNAFMTSVSIKESDIDNTLQVGTYTGDTPTSFDSYALISEPTNNSNNRELGLDLPPNRKDLKSNLIYSLLTFSGTRPAIGDKIYATTPTVSAKTGATSLIRGKLIGIVQARNLLSGTQVDVLISTTNRELFTTSATVFVVNGTTSIECTVTAKGDPDVKTPSGTITHIGNSAFQLSGTTADKRLSIKYITRV